MDTNLYILLRFFDDQSLKKGSIEFRKEFLSAIKDFYPQVTSITPKSIIGGIGIYAKGTEDSLLSKQLNIVSFFCNPDYLRIEYTVQSDLSISSGAFRKRTWAVLAEAGLVKKDHFLPLCTILTSDQMQAINNPPKKENKKEADPLLLEIQEMKKNSQWLSIFNKFAPIDKLSQNQPNVWNNPKLVSEIGFALGKLAETSPRDIPRDEPKKTDFLKQQGYYRSQTEMIRKRCIELFPNNASYHSDLAYLYYLNAIEITLPHGRKGNIISEINNAIAALDKALSIDPTRVKDLYRKGYLLTHILPKQMVFGCKAGDKDLTSRSNDADIERQKGITSYISLINLWESLPQDDYKKIRNKNDYLKTLYSLGDTYHDTIFTKWDETIYALDLREDVATNDKPVFYHMDMEKLEHAWNCFYKCWQSTRENIKGNNPVIDDVLLLYSMGKVLFSKYWLLSGGGQVDTPDALNALSRSIGALEKALETPWTRANQSQKKDFIAERLARAYIAKGQPDSAVSVVNRYKGHRLEAYLANTLALAFHACGKNNEARDILNEAVINKGNKEMWLSYFLIGCSYLREGSIQKANDSFNIAHREAEKTGKENIDGLLVGQAFCAYKSNELKQSIQYLEEAIILNPYRYSIQHRLDKWKVESK